MDPQKPNSTVHQVIGKDGKPLKANATSVTWVGYDYGQEFAAHTTNNEVTPYTQGKLYFADFIEAVNAANEEIYIAGWQVNWDAILDGSKTRLFDVLLAAAKAKPGLKIYVMPWDDRAPVQTYDGQTKAVLEYINDLIDGKRVEVRLATATPDQSDKFFSHHQKQVVIDRKVAFIGGIDLAYGRFDDAAYELKANAHGREALNRYNGCIPWSAMTQEEQKAVIDPDMLVGAADEAGDIKILGTESNRTKIGKKIQSGAWQGNMPDSVTSTDGWLSTVYTTLSPSVQPRMPWQDVHCKIEGPAVSDLTRNFVHRWNLLAPNKPKLPTPAPPENAAKPAKCDVQVLRSAPLKMRLSEYATLTGADKKLHTAPTKAQNDIAQAMYTIIGKAERFIYIENQFFVSAFGAVGEVAGGLGGPAAEIKGAGRDQYLTRSVGDGSVSDLPANKICECLGNKIRDRILADKPFHVIITLPVHPEGLLNDGAVMNQIHWTMQSLVFGTQSLLNRVRRAIKEKEHADEKKKNPKLAALGKDAYKEVGFDACEKYVTLLNLRNWEKLPPRNVPAHYAGKTHVAARTVPESYVTEQIYVHSKVMIVDDMYAIIGSANINDRSLLGGRDSELAVLIVDNDVRQEDVRGNGKKLPVRRFAQRLRQALWGKIFGITGGVRPATELKAMLDKPADPKTWAKIQEIAKHNTAIYEAAFGFIPRNYLAGTEDNPKPTSASIWPTWDKTAKKSKHYMPFEAAFWSNPQHTKAADKLTELKGFMTMLPIHWTQAEDNDLKYNTQLLVKNDGESGSPAGTANNTALAMANPTDSKPKDTVRA